MREPLYLCMNLCRLFVHFSLIYMDDLCGLRKSEVTKNCTYTDNTTHNELLRDREI